MRIKHVVLAIAFCAFFASCENDDEESLPLGAYDNGILVVNEGPFQNGSGTISFLSEDLETNEAAIFNKVNNDDLGNIVQSIGFEGDNAYVVVNNSNKIQVVNRYTFESEASIDAGLSAPRYFVTVNGKGYVTNWGDVYDETDDYIAVINLSSNTVEGTIPVVLGPEKMVVKGDDIYVAHKGAYGINNVISVINSTTQTVDDTITVGFVPGSLQFDDNDNLWVLCRGYTPWGAADANPEKDGQLDRINLEDNTVDFSFSFPAETRPKYLNLDGDNLYYNVGGDLFTLKTTDDALPTSSFLTHTANALYGMNINNGKLYVSDAVDYASNGTLFIYDLNTKALENSITVGLNPNGVYFNE